MKEVIGETLFNIIDKDGSGEISKSELKEFAKVMGMKRSEKNKFFDEIDKDKSGKVDLKEFIAWYTSE